MNLVPQPAVLLPGVRLPLTFVIDPLDLHVHQVPVRPVPPLGFLELWYRGRSARRQRTGFSLIAPSDPVTYGSAEITLGNLPRRSLRERSRLVRWAVDFVRQPEKRARAEAERRQRDDARWYANAQAFLAERDITPGEDGFDAETMAGELGRRGWHWEFAPGGKGYEAHAEKHRYPSSSHSITFSASTSEEALVKVLAAAIKEDESIQAEARVGEEPGV